MPQKKLRIATCQFPVTDNPVKNSSYIKKFINQAADKKAHLVHVSEAALSGYPTMDFKKKSFAGYDWDCLRNETQSIQTLAKKRKIWVLLGSSHYLASGHKPTNCIYLISDQGTIKDRYDKCMLTPGDRRHYTAGNHLVTFTLRGFKCGILICYDGCYPEIYNAYRQKGVEIMFHSFHNARFKKAVDLNEFKPALIRTRAADNAMWIVANNSSAHHSCWPACIARPNGRIAASLTRHQPGILLYDFPDKTPIHIFNQKKMKLHSQEVLHIGKQSRHKRYVNRQAVA